MKTLVALFKRIKWAALATLGLFALVVLWLVRTLFTADPAAPARMPDVPPKLKARVEKAEEEALVARVKAKAEAEVAVEHLDEVAAIDDGRERRRRLAEFLRNQ